MTGAAEAPYRGRELAIVVSTPPERGDLDRALELARAARELGAEVGIFFMHEAVRGVPARAGALAELEADGAELVACASSAEAFGVGGDEFPCALGSQDDHAALVHRAERVVALT